MITDRYSKLPKAIPMKKIGAQDVPHVFAKQWVANYRPPLWLISHNGLQFAAKLLTRVCELVDTTKLLTTTYHPKANGKVERFYKTVLKALWHYVLHHTKDWDLFCELVTHGCNCQARRTDKAIPFERPSARTTPTLIVHKRPDFGESKPGNPSSATNWVNEVKHLMSATSENMRRA